MKVILVIILIIINTSLNAKDKLTCEKLAEKTEYIKMEEIKNLYKNIGYEDSKFYIKNKKRELKTIKYCLASSKINGYEKNFIDALKRNKDFTKANISLYENEEKNYINYLYTEAKAINLSNKKGNKINIQKANKIKKEISIILENVYFALKYKELRLSTELEKLNKLTNNI